MEPALRPFWNRFFRFDQTFGFVLLLMVCVPRFLIVLRANSTGSYGSLSLIMVISALLPFVFLTKTGRRKAGISRPKRYSWLLYGFLIGILFSLLLYFLGDLLYENTPSNWYRYIGRTYKIPHPLTPEDKLIYFSIFAATGMLFSPVGEELFFRGIVHASLATSLGETRASFVDSWAFALTHISHFGLVYLSGAWQFLPVPAFLWVVAMYAVSRLFFLCRQHAGSILGAISCHAGFNLGMTYSIFYLL
ncbi:CPBP family intramembrane glutamic endopeptidase [Larkinella insperata]|uniref:CPBP family intramembrane glutamic endopeptidase n=1 Tax=Larkinella insperata TaxID=332158 RepID=A0ABW3Q6U4_9BACT|nr:CPBP family intramembrane glutamic endopeptidase [Larkinella insperata]